jgi:hypothetical protein
MHNIAVCVCVCVCPEIHAIKALTINCIDAIIPIRLHDETLDEVDSFTYIGSSIDKTGKASLEVDITIEKAGKVYQMWRRRFLGVTIPQRLPKCNYFDLW